MREPNQKTIIGFTVGVWDCWHQGHINFLVNAKMHCDYLVVGIMTDYWVQVQKGHDRPRDSLMLRKMNLLQSELADKIVILDTLDMAPYLQMVDVWIKGIDQKNMKPFEFSNTVYLERTKGISTTDILRGNV